MSLPARTLSNSVNALRARHQRIVHFESAPLRRLDSIPALSQPQRQIISRLDPNRKNDEIALNGLPVPDVESRKDIVLSRDRDGLGVREYADFLEISISVRNNASLKESQVTSESFDLGEDESTG